MKRNNSCIKMIASLSLCVSFPIHPMQKNSKDLFENTPYIFTISDKFADQKQKAFNWMAHLTCKTILQISDGEFNLVTFSKDQEHLLAVSSCLANTINLLNTISIKTGNVIRTIALKKHYVRLACSPDRSRIAALLKDNEIDILDAATGKIIKTIQPPNTNGFSIHTITFNPDGLCIAIGSNRNIHILDIETKTIIRSIPCNNIIASISFTPDKSLIAVTVTDTVTTGTLLILDTNTETIKQTVDLKDFDTYSPVVFGPNNRYIALALLRQKERNQYFNKISIIDAKTLHTLYTIHGSQDSIRSMEFNTDESLLATGSAENWINEYNGKLQIFNLQEAKTIVGTLSFEQYNLLEAFACAARDTKLLPRNQRARIHPNDIQWETWLSLKKLLPEIAIKRLEPYITNK